MTQTTASVATLIAPPGALSAAAVARARAILPDAGAPDWLAPDTAADIPFNAASGAGQSIPISRLRDLAGQGVDVVVQPAANRRKRLFLADMDSTMIGQECIDELADVAGIKPHVAAITERAMRGEIEFEPALRERVALLRDLPVSVVDDVIRDRIRLTGGARTLVQTMRKHGTYTCLVSGGFTLFTDRIAAMIGFDEARANRLNTGSDKLLGTVAEPIFGRATKKQTLIELRGARHLSIADTMTVGDGANDLDMIAEAGLGVAYHAKPIVAEAAPARIDHADLTALLYIQGYRASDFVE